jgi:anaerobic magnesium-protoporphyrin IX monomethyl ester cyclase
MKIILIKPPTVQYKKMFSAGQPIPPIGLAYLSAFLKNHDFEIDIIDAFGEGIDQIYSFNNDEYILQGLTAEQIVERIPNDVDVIGISCMFSSEWIYYKTIIKLVNKIFPSKILVVGGEHVTADWKNLLTICPEVNYCVLGEGEETFLELLNSIKNKAPTNNIQGIAYTFNGQVIQNQRRGRMTDLDKIPLPDWSKIPIHAYLKTGNSMSGINKRAMPILASRGCPYKCTFCTSPQMWGTKMYYRSPKMVIGEIKELYNKYQINHIDMIDIVGLFNLAWTKEFLNELIEANLPITWLHAAGTRSEIMNKEVLDLLVKSKAVRVHFSPESGSEATLNRIGKKIKLSKFLITVKMASQKNLSIRSALIIGFPDQTIYEVIESLLFGFKLIWFGVDDVVIHSYSALPGSELYMDLINSGAINTQNLIDQKQYDKFLSKEVVTRIFTSVSWSSHIPSFAIPIIQTTFMSLYYIFNYIAHPQKIFRSFSRLKCRQPLTLAEHMIYNLIFKKKYINKKNLIGPIS